jgi:hypothetical protein
MIKKSIGRPAKFNYKVITRLEDALRNGATVSEACDYAGISRDTYYRYLKSEDVFAKRMKVASSNKLLLPVILF